MKMPRLKGIGVLLQRETTDTLEAVPSAKTMLSWYAELSQTMSDRHQQQLCLEAPFASQLMELPRDRL